MQCRLRCCCTADTPAIDAAQEEVRETESNAVNIYEPSAAGHHSLRTWLIFIIKSKSEKRCRKGQAAVYGNIIFCNCAIINAIYMPHKRVLP